MQKNKTDFSCCAAIVTYGNRFAFLEKSINFCIQSELIQAIVIIDNNSSQETKNGITKLISQTEKKISCYELDKNYGSALGFKKAIEEALKSGLDLVYLLDDDNLPKKDCLLKQFNFISSQKEKTEAGLLSVIANRIDRINFQEIIKNEDPEAMLQPKNHYLGIHYRGVFEKLKERLFNNGEVLLKEKIAPQKVVAAPYSGLLFHRSLVEKVGLPNEKFILYMDDFDFTIRILGAGGEIWLLPDAIIQDIENSVYLPEKKKMFYHSAFDGNINQMYYLFRNMKYFGDKHLVDNRFKLAINKVIFWLSISIIGILRGKFKELTMLKTAVKDANQEKLGESEQYTLK